MSLNPLPENLKKGKILDPYLRELLGEHDKYICLNQDKTLSNLRQRIAFVYAPLTKIWTAMEAEKESYVADEGEIEELVAKSLSSKNRSKELFGSIKSQ